MRFKVNLLALLLAYQSAAHPHGKIFSKKTPLSVEDIAD
jgi:hypothetical protein